MIIIIMWYSYSKGHSYFGNKKKLTNRNSLKTKETAKKQIKLKYVIFLKKQSKYKYR